MKTRLLTTVLFVAFFYNLLSAQLTIHTIGDSTMEQKSEDPIANPNGQRGWPQMLSQFVVNGATINNRKKWNKFKELLRRQGCQRKLSFLAYSKTTNKSG